MECSCLSPALHSRPIRCHFPTLHCDSSNPTKETPRNLASLAHSLTLSKLILQPKMPKDLRGTLAKAELQTRQLPRPRSKWVPGAWQAAAAYNATKPETQCPVVVGGDSIIQTPEQLREVCHMSYVPEIIETTTSGILALPNGEPEPEHDPDVRPVQVCDVSLRQCLDLKKATGGKKIVVWFHGRRTYAWLVQSLEKGRALDDRVESSGPGG